VGVGLRCMPERVDTLGGSLDGGPADRGRVCGHARISLQRNAIRARCTNAGPLDGTGVSQAGSETSGLGAGLPNGEAGEAASLGLRCRLQQMDTLGGSLEAGQADRASFRVHARIPLQHIAIWARCTNAGLLNGTGVGQAGSETSGLGPSLAGGEAGETAGVGLRRLPERVAAGWITGVRTGRRGRLRVHARTALGTS
jgi:hypothetical protein